MRHAVSDDQPVSQCFQIPREGFERSQKESHAGRSHVRSLEDRVIPAEERDHRLRTGERLVQ